MNYHVIRRRSNHQLEAFGPVGGDWACPYDAATHTMTVEDHNDVLAEWATSNPFKDYRKIARDAIQAYLDGTMTARDALAAIKDAL